MLQHNSIRMQKTDDFIMLPKIDFAFKLIFGDENNKDILMDFLGKVLRVSVGEFEALELVNEELAKELMAEQRGSLNVRVRTKEQMELDIVIQVIPHHYKPESNLFYWSNKQTKQVEAGSKGGYLKKCITINVVDFKCIPVNKMHTIFHIFEDETGHKLTDMLEVHFLELKKIEENRFRDKDDLAKNWAAFLNAQSKKEMELLANKDNHIRKAYEILQVASRDEAKRLAYEAREAELMEQRAMYEMRAKILKDKVSALNKAREEGINEGIKEGIKEGVYKVARGLKHEGIQPEVIQSATGLTLEEINTL